MKGTLLPIRTLSPPTLCLLCNLSLLLLESVEMVREWEVLTPKQQELNYSYPALPTHCYDCRY